MVSIPVSAGRWRVVAVTAFRTQRCGALPELEIALTFVHDTCREPFCPEGRRSVPGSTSVHCRCLPPGWRYMHSTPLLPEAALSGCFVYTELPKHGCCCLKRIRCPTGSL